MKHEKSKGDLISRSELLANKENFVSSTWGLAIAISDIEEVDVVDAELVRHGTWVFNPNGIYDDNTWICSECEEPWVLIDGTPADNGMNYCPHCGAKMDGGENNGYTKQ